MADEPKKEEKKEAPKEASASAGPDMWDNILFWGIILIIVLQILRVLSGWVSGDFRVADTRIGNAFKERGYDLSWIDIFADKKDSRATGSGSAGVDDQDTLRRGGRTLIGIDTNGDGIIDEYIDDPESDAPRASAWSRFWADPSYSTFKRILSEHSALSFFFNLLWWLVSIVAILLMWAIIVMRRTIAKLEGAVDKEYNTPITYAPVEDEALSRWKRIVEKLQSENPESWKMAILECDIILDEILDSNGYRGDSIGEKMQRVERSDFNTIDAAWEAHKIRNAIAHQGEGFVLTSREARRVIGLYERVFREFEYIV